MLILAQTFSILLHEGSITFSLIWFVALSMRHNNILNYIIRSKTYLLLIPTTIYLIMRIVVHSLPSNGFMEVNLSNIIYDFGYYFNSSWNIPFLDAIYNRTKSIYSFIFLIFLIPIFILKKTRKNLLFFYISTMILILPFAALPNHIVYNRAFWSYPFYTFFLILMFDTLLKKHNTVFSKLILAAITSTFIFQATSQRQKSLKTLKKRTSNYSTFINQAEHELDRISTIDKSFFRIAIKLKKYDSLKRTSEHHKFFFTVIPISLLSQIKNINKTIFISLFDSVYPNGIKNFILKDQAFFEIKKEENSTIIANDLYHNGHIFTITDLNTPIVELPILFNLEIRL
jgi:hypothetical protein